MTRYVGEWVRTENNEAEVVLTSKSELGWK